MSILDKWQSGPRRRLVVSGSDGNTMWGYDPWGKRVTKNGNAEADKQAGYYTGTWEFTFYGMRGQRLATVGCLYDNGPQHLYCGMREMRDHFGGRLLWTRGQTTNRTVVARDRLGSVRAVKTSAELSYLSYYPYGEERGSSADGREKFGTYFRDLAGQDYADQRYYDSRMGRFWTPDAMGLKGVDMKDPGSWNRYAYVGNDPVNFRDVHGRCRTGPEDEWDDCSGDFPNDWRPGRGEAETRDPWNPPEETGAGGGRPIDSVTDASARKRLGDRLPNFKGSNCDKVFGGVIEGYSTSGLTGKVSATEFYNVNSAGISGLTQNQVSGNGNSTTLGATLIFGETARTLNDGTDPAVLLGANFFSNSNAVYQGNVLLHELLHAYTGWGDADIFTNFEDYGLRKLNPGSEDISAWLSTDCTKTPTSLTWWK